jgi:imidazolonepropionase-like amidohydrolase
MTIAYPARGFPATSVAAILEAMILPLLFAAAVAVADTTVYPVMNHGLPAGEMRVVTDGDSIVITYAHIDRQRGRWVQTRYGTADGRIVRGEVRPMARTGEVSAAAEMFEIVGDSVRWRRGTQAPRTLLRGDGVLWPSNATAWEQAWLVRDMLARGLRSAPVIPTESRMRLEIAADTMLATSAGRERVRLVMMHGLGSTPQAVWIDADGELAASAVGWFITVHPRFVGAMSTFRAIESAYRNAAGNALAARIPTAVRGNVTVIRNVDVFDSERGVVVPRQSVIISGDRITAVGPVAGINTPRGAAVVDGTGKTLVPGLWDMHTHFQLTSQTNVVLRHLAIGVTTIRDMAADTDVGVSHRDRANNGTIVSPRVILAGFIEGPTLWRGPSDVLVATEAEARAWVARYDSLGFKQIKLYNAVHPDLVPTIAEEARKRGMRLSGHIPRGMTVPAAIRLGFDEINHGAFLFSTFYQDSLYVPTMRAYSGVAAIVAPNIDVDGPEMTALIADLKAHNTVIDGTFNLWMRDSLQADSVEAKRANRAYLRVIKRLHDAGVTIVPGTDGSSLNNELEHYVQAGIPAAQVLQLATLGSARVMRDDALYGSVAVGKVADLVLINGKPTERIADLRNIELVIRAGRAYTPKALTDAASTSTYRPAP